MDSLALKEDFTERFLINNGLKSSGYQLNRLAGDGSSRSFFRISLGEYDRSYVIMENPPMNSFLSNENRAYLKIGKHLFNKGLPVPEIYQYDLDKGLFILEDMGDINLREKISQGDDPMHLYERVMETLFRLQIEGLKGFEAKWCCQTTHYDHNVMLHYESHYFRDAFLKDFLRLQFDWNRMEKTFNYLAANASRVEKTFFLHRDFQPRNIMVNNNRIGILDWQGGRLGPLAYDLASLIIESYSDLALSQKHNLYESYLILLQESKVCNIHLFKRCYPYIAIQRNLQILGAFAYLTQKKGKPFFKGLIGPAMESLCQLIEETEDNNLKYLKEISQDILLMMLEHQ